LVKKRELTQIVGFMQNETD